MTPRFQPATYWSGLVRGDGRLANVGHPRLGAYNRWAYRLRLTGLRRAIRDVDLGGARVFAGGFGEGYYLRHWSESGAAQVDGVDISPRAVESARRRFPRSRFRRADLTSGSWARDFGRYDLVTALDVLYHVVDDRAWEGALDNLLGLVDRGGVFVTTEKFPRFGVSQRYSHVRRRSLAMWREVLGERGFEVRRIVPVFLFMDDPITDGARPWLGRLATVQWKVATEPIKALKSIPRVQAGLATAVAAAQWLPEKLATLLLTRTPNLEMLVCSRSG
jgi:hypothetical protein